MYKLWRCVIKENILLLRDWGGLAILFVMPIFLVIVVTLIQNNTYENITNQKMTVLVVDKDKGLIAQELFNQAEKSGSFAILKEIDHEELTETKAREAVQKGQYQLAIVVPENLSRDVQHNVNAKVEQVLESIAAVSESEIHSRTETGQEIRIYFDPALQISYREGIKNTIDKIVAQIESKTIYNAFAEQLELPEQLVLSPKETLFQFKEISPRQEQNESIPNAVQHNVPAWSLFAIYFIIVPLAMNIVKEKNQGTKVRLYTMPTSTLTLLGGKIISYLLLCLLQFYLILGIGKYVFPLLGLTAFKVGTQFINLSILTIFSGLSAISIGILLGTIAKTQEQSSPFGATFVVILAAVSGVWIPTFAMPEVMGYIASISPMNWALEGYYILLLREGSLGQIRFEIILLLLFSIATIGIALLYDKKKRSL